MKPIKIIATNLLLFFVASMSAQEIDPEKIEDPFNKLSYGVKAGLNYATATKGTASTPPDSRLGLYAGIMGEIPIINELLSIQGEVLYSEQGFERIYKISGEELTAEYHINYINIPILAKYYLVKGFSIEGGPQFGFLISDKINTPFSREETPIPDKIKSFDLSIALGTSFEFDGGLFINMRYTHGFNNVIDEIDSKNTTFQIGLGYKF